MHQHLKDKDSLLKTAVYTFWPETDELKDEYKSLSQHGNTITNQSGWIYDTNNCTMQYKHPFPCSLMDVLIFYSRDPNDTYDAPLGQQFTCDMNGPEGVSDLVTYQGLNPGDSL